MASVRLGALSVLALSVSLLGGAPGHAQPTPPRASVPSATPAIDRSAWLYAGSDIPRDEGWQFGTLSNGLRYAVRRNGVPPGQVSIRLRVDVGSLMEEPGQAGWAHLIEHLAFRESQYLESGEARRAWQRLGVSFGSDTNASTSATQTVYQLDIPTGTAASLNESLRLMSGMMRAPVLTDATVNAERPIVLAERRENDGPAFRVATATREHLFAGQRYGEHPIIGSETTLGAANGASLSAFHARWYRPERTVIAIAGDLEPKVLEEAIVQHFGSWRVAGSAGTEPDFGRPDPSKPLASVVVEPSLPLVANLSWVRPWTRVTDTVEYTHGLMRDTLAMLILNRRLEERARNGGRFVVANGQDEKISRSAWITTMTVAPIGSDWAGAIADARSVIAASLATPPTAAEIAREASEVDSFLSVQAANAVNEPGTKQADDLIKAVDIGETTTSPDHALAIWRSMVARVTPADIQRHLRTLFSGTQRAVLVSPTHVSGGEATLARAVTGEARALAASGATRAVRIADLPALGTPGRVLSRSRFAGTDFDAVELSNGVKALVRETAIEPDKVRIRVRFGTGRQGIDPRRPNLLWAGEGALVESGIGRFDQSALDRMVAGRAIGMGFRVDDDAFVLTAETNRADLADQLRFLATKLAAPGWNATPVERLRAGTLLTFNARRSSPMGVIESDLDALLYGGDPRFAAPTREQVSALTPQAFRAFWAPILASGPVEVQVFGDTANLGLDRLLGETFGALPRRNAGSTPYDVTLAARPAAPTTLRHSGGAGQAAAIIAYPTGATIAPLDARTERQLEILAAVFNNRLYERLRDQAGASYSQAVVSNPNRVLKNAGYIFVGGMVPPDKTQLLLDTARSIAEELTRADVSNDEIRRAIGPAREQVIRAATGNVFWMNQTDRALRDPSQVEDLRRYLVDLSGTTPADLRVLAQRYLAPDNGRPVLVVPEGR